jgi:PilZ domain-containing protein
MPPNGVRRSGRIPREFAIFLIGSDLDGTVFSEQTNTVVVSRDGAGVVSHYKLAPEQEMVIRRPDTNREVEVRVVGVIGSQSDRYTYGLAFLNPTTDFWGIEFPPLTESEKAASRLLLECGGCKGREIVDLSDLESDIYAANDSVRRPCKRCGSTTVWRQALGDIEVPVAPQPKPDPKPSSAALLRPRPQNRRKYLRTKVSFQACIRRPDSGDEIVFCEDVSRGGLRFKSLTGYAEKSMIEVSAPYSPGPSNIFVPAQIVFVQELKEQKLFRCGAAYISSPKTPSWTT